MTNKVPVFYDRHQSPPDTESFSPSAGKPAKVIADWLSRPEIADNIEVIGFDQIEEATIGKAHHPYYVAKVLNLSINNGFGNKDADTATSLMYTTASVLAAAEYAIEHQAHTCSPTSGFHHAGYEFGGGFCTFNGLMIAAVSLHDSGHAKTIGILDLDAHFGNGSADIIKRKKIDYVKHFSAGAEFISLSDVGHRGKFYFAWLEKAIDTLQSCDVILCQLGADPHFNDPLGGMLTTAEMKKRDFMVFNGFKGKPLVWTLAGGYQRDASGGIEPVLALHRNSIIECINRSQP